MKATKDILKENEELKSRLAEAEELLAAIKAGEVDAFVTDDQQVFTLKTADHAYRVLVETINEGALTLAFDGTIMYCNSHLAAMLDLPIENIIGSSIFSLVTTDELARFKATLRRCENSTARAEFQLKKNDGTLLPALISCTSLKLADTTLCMVITDLTEQKKTAIELENHREHLEELVKERTGSLRDSEERFRALTETSSLAVGVSSSDGKFFYLNKAYEKLFGCTLEELNRKNASEFWCDPEDRRKMIDDVRSKGFLMNYEVKLKRKDGTPFWATLSVNQINYGGNQAIMASVYDVTERKRAEEAFKESELRYRRLFESAKDGILILDFDSGLIVDVNPFLTGLLGYSREDLCKKYLWEIGPFKDIVSSKESFLKLQTTNYIRYEDLPLQVKGGKKIDVEFVSNVYLVDRKKVIQCNIRDITIRKRAEDILKRDKKTMEKLVQAQARELLETHIELDRATRLSDIGTLSATVAHELRNPLAAIQMAAHNIKRKAKNPEIDKHLANIEKKVGESDQIINNLLFYSRLKPPHYETMNILDIIEECADALQKPDKKEVMVIKDLASLKGVCIEADSIQIKEVLNNMLNNALDAVPSEKGEIKITAENEDEFIKVAIEDNGSGIDKKILDKVFNPFFTTKAKGTGLGLSVCRQIINMHDGDIGIKSEPGQGTSVIFRLPKKERKKERKNKWPLNEF